MDPNLYLKVIFFRPKIENQMTTVHANVLQEVQNHDTAGNEDLQNKMMELSNLNRAECK
jgi:hypothetical protein